MPDASLLETFPTPAAAPIVIEHVTDEFTSRCPKTGHPDFGTIIIRYQPPPPPPPGAPDDHPGTHGCVELKSLKLYCQSFREAGIYYEAVTDRIRDDLVMLLEPVWLQVITQWKGRGGFRSVIRAEHGEVPAEWRGR